MKINGIRTECISYVAEYAMNFTDVLANLASDKTRCNASRNRHFPYVVGKRFSYIYRWAQKKCVEGIYFTDGSLCDALTICITYPNRLAGGGGQLASCM